MTAPARTAAPKRTLTRRRGAEPERVRSRAVQRAYARREQRTGTGHVARDGSDAARRTPFVVLVMVLLAVALVATLWLSTAAAADSYHLQGAQEQARNLTERSENLSREVAELETAPEIARRARELGMVPAGDPARLLVRLDGTVVRIGEPHRATAPAPVPVQPVPVQPVPVPAAVPIQPVPAQPEPPVPAQPAPAQPVLDQPVPARPGPAGGT